MKLGIIGAGNMGSGLGSQWAFKGHQVFFGSREPDRAKEIAAGVGHDARGGSYEEAARFGEIALLAVPWRGLDAALRAVDSLLDGKILIDCTNPLSPDFMTLLVGFETSAAEEIARRARGAVVVKAFNGTYAEIIHSSPVFGGQNATVFYAGDDPRAKLTVAGLILEIGFEPVDAGPLLNARLLEPMGALMMQLAHARGNGIHQTYKLIHRTEQQERQAEKMLRREKGQYETEEPEPVVFGR
jgi:NADPH-dependent F420 reductase